MLTLLLLTTSLAGGASPRAGLSQSQMRAHIERTYGPIHGAEARPGGLVVRVSTAEGPIKLYLSESPAGLRLRTARNLLTPIRRQLRRRAALGHPAYFSIQYQGVHQVDGRPYSVDLRLENEGIFLSGATFRQDDPKASFKIPLTPETARAFAVDLVPALDHAVDLWTAGSTAALAGRIYDQATDRDF